MNHDLTERVVGDVLARLVSVPMETEKAAPELVWWNTLAEKVLGIEGLFKIERI